MKKWHYPFLAFLLIGSIIILSKSKKAAPEYMTDEGMVFGTVYRITYLNNENLRERIEETLALVDNALSMFNSESVI